MKHSFNEASAQPWMVSDDVKSQTDIHPDYLAKQIRKALKVATFECWGTWGLSSIYLFFFCTIHFFSSKNDCLPWKELRSLATQHCVCWLGCDQRQLIFRVLLTERDNALRRPSQPPFFLTQQTHRQTLGVCSLLVSLLHRAPPNWKLSARWKQDDKHKGRNSLCQVTCSW